MRFEFKDCFINLGVPEAGSTAGGAGGSRVTMGGLNLHAVKFGA